MKRLGLLLCLTTACATAPSQGVKVPIAPPTLPIAELEAALQSPELAQRAVGAWQLARASEVSPEARSRLNQLLHEDPEERVRLAAAWALGHLRVPPPPGVAPPDPQPSDDQLPRVLRQPRPHYPKDNDAFEKGTSGTVVLDVLIDERGQVAHAEVRESVPLLDKAALESVRGWVFTPATHKGRPVATVAIAEIKFSVQ